jgi:hypothetical protein
MFMGDPKELEPKRIQEKAVQEVQLVAEDRAVLETWATLINAHAASESIKTTLVPLLENRVALTSHLKRLDAMGAEYNVLDHTIEVLRQYEPTQARSARVARATVWTILLHDHGKVERFDKLHQLDSAHIAKRNFSLLSDIYHPTFAAQVVRLVGNHHLFENIYNGTVAEKEAHAIVPTQEDLDIMYRVTLADLRAYPQHHQYISPAKVIYDRLLTRKSFAAFTFEATPSGELGANS